MLRALEIRDLLIIDHLELDFQPGLNVLTGETGAGKSILLDSLGFVLGWRGRAELVRAGADAGEVVAEFQLPDHHPAHSILDEAGLPGGEELILRRVNRKDGRKTAWVNDRRCSGEVLRSLSETLVELHGQHDDRGLLDTKGHRALLDQYGALSGLIDGTRTAWRDLSQARKTLRAAEVALKAVQEEEDFLRHAVSELDSLDPQPGEEGDLDAREQTLERAVSDTDELLGIFNSILSLSRLESGESRKTINRMDPALVAEDLAETYEYVCEDDGLEFSFEVERGMEVFADRGLLLQGLDNLLGNAVKYTPAGGAVTLRLRRNSEGCAEFSVTDTGPGIPDADRERVTQRFVRLDNSRTLPGSGLGLSLVQAIVDVHNGKFELGEGPGHVEGGHGPGLRASMCFPLAPAPQDEGV